MKDDLREFRNLQSLVVQWKMVNARMDASFRRQTQNALDEIYDRFIQVMKLREENYELERSLFTKTQILCLEETLHSQYDVYAEIEVLEPQFTKNFALLRTKVQNALNRLQIDRGVGVDPHEMEEGLKLSKELLSLLEEETKAKRDEIHQVVQSLEELEDHVQAEAKEFEVTRELMK